MKEKIEFTTNNIFKALAGLLLITPGAILMILAIILIIPASYAFVLLKFYSWFLLPVFVGLPIITYYQALGLIFTANILKYKYTNSKKEKNDNFWSSFTNAILAPWVSLYLGYLLHNYFL
jgi:hypothetical protein